MANNNKYKFKIEGQQFEWSEQYITGLQVKQLVGAPLEAELYLKSKPGADQVILNTDSIDLGQPGLEQFYFKNIYEFTLEANKFKSYKARVKGGELLDIAGITDTRCYTLYQKLQGCEFEKVPLDNIVDLSNPGIEHFILKDADTFVYTVNGEHEMIDKKYQSANETLLKAGIDNIANYLVLIIGEGEIVYAWNPDELITMDCKGMEFVSRSWVEEVNVEEYGKTCKPVPPSKRYKIKVDSNYHLIYSRYISHDELISLGGKPGTQYDVLKFLSSSPKPVKVLPGVMVDLHEPCLVKFVLSPKELTEGRGERRQFLLPEDDIETLNKLGLPWETIVSGTHWVIINDYPIPQGYNVDKAVIALMIPPAYPVAEIDMVYFYPSLARGDNKTIRCLTNQLIDDRTFQRWSRHRQPGEWRHGIDNIATHLVLVDNLLISELRK